jgi:uncharacterized Ntn-hydrolase superfamily protein
MSRKSRFPFAHTFSIVARDAESGQMGVAVQSHWFSVGSLVTWGEAGVGVVATQAMVNVSYGPLGLAMMRSGHSAPQALKALLAADDDPGLRQVAMVDAQGRVGTHTGERCIQPAGHRTGEGFSCQANMMANDRIWGAMADAYQAARGDLSERLISALQAAQSAGGDVRGQQSAAILVVKGTPSGRSWSDRVLDLRVEDHPQPVDELQRLVTLQRAYDLMNTGDDKLGAGQTEEALAAYQGAAALAPHVLEMPFWHAVTLADLGRVDEALPIFEKVFASEAQWIDLLKRLPAAGLIKADEAVLQRILSVSQRT